MLWPRLLELVRHVSAKCPPCVCFGCASKPCPPSARLVSALCLSALSPLWLPLQTSAAMCRSGLVSASPCIRLVSAGFGRASKRCVSHVALCVCHVSAPCLFFCPLVVRSLFALHPLFVGFWPGLWFGFGRAIVSSVSALWFLRLCLFCVRCCPP